MKDYFDINGKVAFVTGGSRGIGKMVAKAYVAAGVRVYISSRNTDKCVAVAKELTEFGECKAIPADLSKLAEVRRVGDFICSQEKRVHILVNNAGTAWGERLDIFPEKGWNKVFDLNLKSPFFLTQEFLSLLENGAQKDDPARIINIGSIDGMHSPLYENYSYASAKSALHHLTKLISERLACKKINACAIAPGYFDTDMTVSLVQTYGLDKLLSIVPQKRLGSESDIEGVAVFLASRASAYINGIVLPVDGGITGGL